MKNRKEIVQNRVVRQISLFLCLILALSNLQVMQADAAVAVPETHYLTPYQTTYYTVYDNDELESFQMMGTKYYQGIKGKDSFEEKIALYNLDGDFTSVTFVVGHLDDASKSSTVLNVYTDNDLVKEIQLTGDMVTQTVTIDTRNVQQLKLSGTSGWGRYCVANVIGIGGHVYESEVTKIATVKQSGIRTYTCKYCEDDYTETINAQINCIPLLQPYQKSNVDVYVNDEKSYFNIMGKRYYNGIVGKDTFSSKEVLFNLSQNYPEVSFTVGHLDGASRDGATLYVYSDGVQQKEISLNGDMMNETVIVNTEGVTQLKIVLGSGWGRYAIFDMNYETNLKQEHSFDEEIDAAGGFVTYTCRNCGAYYVEPYRIDVTDITLNPSSLALKVGDTAQLTARVTPDNATDADVNWSSDNTAAAKVNSNGVVTAVGEGSAVITAEAGTFTAQCQVTVEKKQNTNQSGTTSGGSSDSGQNNQLETKNTASLILSTSTVTLYTGKTANTAQITANVTGSSRKVTWQSSNEAVAAVSSNGKIAAVSQGNAIVTATANGIQKTVSVTVKNPTITAKKSGKNVKSVTVKKKKTVKLSLGVQPAGSGISFSSLTAKQKKIASVKISGSKLVIVGKKKGKFSITLKSGASAKKIKITVKK